MSHERREQIACSVVEAAEQETCAKRHDGPRQETRRWPDVKHCEDRRCQPEAERRLQQTTKQRFFCERRRERDDQNAATLDATEDVAKLVSKVHGPCETRCRHTREHDHDRTDSHATRRMEQPRSDAQLRQQRLQMTAPGEKGECDYERRTIEAEKVFDAEVAHVSWLSVSALIGVSKATLMAAALLLVCVPAGANEARWYGPQPQHAPQRIVSLAPSTTEILFALGVGENVVAVTRYCDFPQEAAKRAKVGGVLDLNVEAVAALKPDLVVGIEARAAERAYAQLGELGIATLEVPSDVLADFTPGVSVIAAAIHKDGAPLVKAFEEGLRNLPNSPPKRTLIIVEARPLIAAGDKSFVGAALALIGLTSIAKNGLYPELNRETLVASQLDLVVDLARPTTELPFRVPTLHIRDERLLRLSPRLPQALRELYEQLPTTR